MVSVKCDVHTGAQRAVTRGQLSLATSFPQATKNHAEDLMEMHTELFQYKIYNHSGQWYLKTVFFLKKSNLIFLLSKSIISIS